MIHNTCEIIYIVNFLSMIKIAHFTLKSASLTLEEPNPLGSGSSPNPSLLCNARMEREMRETQWKRMA